MSAISTWVTKHTPKGFLIYLLGFYVLVQFVWWAYMLVQLNAEIYNLKLELLLSGISSPEQLIQKADLDQKLSLRIWMVLGEGAVFVSILLLGFWSVRKSITKELMLAEQQKNFLLSVTHELKSPLAAIKLQLQTLSARSLDEDKKQLIYSRALSDTDRLEKLVENLLLVNKVESEKLPLTKEPINLSKLLLEILDTTYSSQINAGKLIVDSEQNIILNMDSMAFQSIVLNLVENAIKYAGESKVEVSLEVLKDNTIQLEVRDYGDGIPDSEKEKIFERFYRLGNEEVRKTKGTGIGLYLVKLLVENHDGRISVENNHPTGAIFRVILSRPKK